LFNELKAVDLESNLYFYSKTLLKYNQLKTCIPFLGNHFIQARNVWTIIRKS